MNFKIYDGREHFYQWDLDRKLIVENPDIKEVHFCNRADNCSLVCEVFEENGQRLVNVPNILLQTDWRIRAYAYDGNCTKYEEIFNVKARTKPADYVYTEVEIKNYEDLEKRIEVLEENGLPEGAVEEAVEAYLAENPVEVDLSDYYNKEQVDKAISNVEVDLTGYATEKYVDDAIADIEVSGGGDSGIHVGEEEPTGNEDIWLDPDDTEDLFVKTVNGQKPDTNGNVEIEISGADVDLTGYATEKYVDDAIAEIEVTGGAKEWKLIEEYILEEDVSELSFDAKGTEGFAIHYQGRLNNADNTANDSSATGAVTMYRGRGYFATATTHQIGYVRKSSNLTSTFVFEKLFDTYVKCWSTLNPSYHGVGTTIHISNNGYKDTVYMYPADNTLLFKAGSKITVWGLVKE